jgi:ClpP class serine protease
MRASEFITTYPWAITEPWLHTIYDIATRENVVTPEILDKIEKRKEAVLSKKARLMDGTSNVQKVDGVAVIEVAGPIFRYADLFMQISGATAIESLALDFKAAMDDPSVAGIILSFDSPGGMLSGVNEFADQVHAAREKKTKPIFSYVPDMAASAAYWIASAADQIVVNDNAELGSIGVVITARKARDNGGIEVVSSQSPNKRLAPETEAGRASLQKAADAHAEVFISRVARNRGIEAAKVASDYGKGGMFVGQAAVDAGLADRLGSLEGLIAEIGNGTYTSRASNRSASAMKETSMDTTNKSAHEAALASKDAEIETMKAQLAKFAEEARASRESAAKMEAKAFVATLTAANDLRFGKTEIEKFGEIYESAKVASTSDDSNLKAFASAVVVKLEGYVAAKSPVAPAGEKKPATVPEGGKLSAEDFANYGNDPEIDAKIAKAQDEYIAAKKLTGADRYQVALDALSKAAGVRSSHAAPGNFSGSDADEVDEE